MTERDAIRIHKSAKLYLKNDAQKTWRDLVEAWRIARVWLRITQSASKKLFLYGFGLVIAGIALASISLAVQDVAKKLGGDMAVIVGATVVLLYTLRRRRTIGS